jgi:hypothetical protein
MKFITSCPICRDQLCAAGIIPEEGQYDGNLEPSFEVEYGNDFVLRGSCPTGHPFLGRIRKERYDILFGSALNSYLSGFELEAVLGLSASLERAQELFCWVALHSNDVDLQTIEALWKSVSNQSERQLGMFHGQWLLASGRLFHVDQKMVEFRNKVVHKGHIATRAEVKVYAAWITEKLFEIAFLLKINLQTSLDAVIRHNDAKSLATIETMRQNSQEFATARVVHVSLFYYTNLHVPAEHFAVESFEQVCERAARQLRYAMPTIRPEA